MTSSWCAAPGVPTLQLISWPPPPCSAALVNTMSPRAMVGRWTLGIFSEIWFL